MKSLVAFIHTPPGIAIMTGLKITLILCMAWLFYLFSKKGERLLLDKWHQDRLAASLFSKISLLLIGVCSLLLILPILGIPVGGLLAFGGIGGVVVGFAAKDALANVLGGFILAIDRPFSIGDHIYTTDGKLEGWIESIGWRITTIRTLDKQILYVPNHFFSSTVYVNKSRVTHYRIWKTLSVRYQDMEKVPAILEEIREYLRGRPDLDKGEYHFIHLTDLSDPGFSLEFRVYVKTSSHKEYYRVMEEVLLKIYNIVKKAGGELAYPTQTLYVNRD